MVERKKKSDGADSPARALSLPPLSSPLSSPPYRNRVRHLLQLRRHGRQARRRPGPGQGGDLGQLDDAGKGHNPVAQPLGHQGPHQVGRGQGAPGEDVGGGVLS